MRELIIAAFGSVSTALAIIVAVIGVAGVLGGAAMSYIVSQQTVYVNAITSERMKWVGTLRQNISKLMTVINRIQVRSRISGFDTPSNLLIDIEELMSLRHLIILQLNPSGLIDGRVIKIIDAVIAASRNLDPNDIGRLLLVLENHSQWLLKGEWERVKNEARSLIGKLWHIKRSGREKQRYLEFYYGPHSGMPLVRRYNKSA